MIKNSKKHILILLAITLCFSFVFFLSFNKKVEANYISTSHTNHDGYHVVQEYYYDFVAFDGDFKAQTWDHIYLTQDYVLTSPWELQYSQKGSSLLICLNGHTITYNNSNEPVIKIGVSGINVYIDGGKNCCGTSGKIINTLGDAIEVTNGNLTLTDVDVECATTKSHTGIYIYPNRPTGIEDNKTRTTSVNINGGTFTGKSAVVEDVDENMDGDSISVSVNSGIFNTTGAAVITNSLTEQSQMPIKGGTYNVDPSNGINKCLYHCVQDVTTKKYIVSGHDFEHEVAKNKTCTVDGNIEYYYCETCDTYVNSDKNTILSYPDDIKISKSHHSPLDHHDYLAPSGDANGNLEYWYCVDCENYYLDANCINLTSEAGVTLNNSKVFSVNNVGYITLEDALKAVGSKGKISLLANSQGSIVVDGIDLTIDFAGREFNFASDDANTKAMFTVINGGKLTLKDSVGTTVLSDSKNIVYVDNGTIIIDGATLKVTENLKRVIEANTNTYQNNIELRSGKVISKWLSAISANAKISGITGKSYSGGYYTYNLYQTLNQAYADTESYSFTNYHSYLEDDLVIDKLMNIAFISNYAYTAANQTKSEGNYYGYIHTNGYDLTIEDSTFTLEDGTAVGAKILYIDSKSTVIINGGNILNSKGNAIVNEGELKVYGGTISSTLGYGIYNRGGQVLIGDKSDGLFTYVYGATAIYSSPYRLNSTYHSTSVIINEGYFQATCSTIINGYGSKVASAFATGADKCTMIINDGEFKTTTHYDTIVNYGIMTVNYATVIDALESVFINYASAGYGTLIINDGSFTSNDYVVINAQELAELEINGGSYNGNGYLVARNLGKAKINPGNDSVYENNTQYDMFEIEGKAVLTFISGKYVINEESSGSIVRQEGASNVIFEGGRYESYSDETPFYAIDAIGENGYKLTGTLNFYSQKSPLFIIRGGYVQLIDAIVDTGNGLSTVFDISSSFHSFASSYVGTLIFRDSTLTSSTIDYVVYAHNDYGTIVNTADPTQKKNLSTNIDMRKSTISNDAGAGLLLYGMFEPIPQVKNVYNTIDLNGSTINTKDDCITATYNKDAGANRTSFIDKFVNSGNRILLDNVNMHSTDGYGLVAGKSDTVTIDNAKIYSDKKSAIYFGLYYYSFFSYIDAEKKEGIVANVEYSEILQSYDTYHDTWNYLSSYTRLAIQGNNTVVFGKTYAVEYGMYRMLESDLVALSKKNMIIYNDWDEDKREDYYNEYYGSNCNYLEKSTIRKIKITGGAFSSNPTFFPYYQLNNTTVKYNKEYEGMTINVVIGIDAEGNYLGEIDSHEKAFNSIMRYTTDRDASNYRADYVVYQAEPSATNPKSSLQLAIEDSVKGDYIVFFNDETTYDNLVVTHDLIFTTFTSLFRDASYWGYRTTFDIILNTYQLIIQSDSTNNPIVEFNNIEFGLGLYNEEATVENPDNALVVVRNNAKLIINSSTFYGSYTSFIKVKNASLELNGVTFNSYTKQNNDSYMIVIEDSDAELNYVSTSEGNYSTCRYSDYTEIEGSWFVYEYYYFYEATSLYYDNYYRMINIAGDSNVDINNLNMDIKYSYHYAYDNVAAYDSFYVDGKPESAIDIINTDQEVVLNIKNSTISNFGYGVRIFGNKDNDVEVNIFDTQINTKLPILVEDKTNEQSETTKVHVNINNTTNANNPYAIASIYDTYQDIIKVVSKCHAGTDIQVVCNGGQFLGNIISYTDTNKNTDKYYYYDYNSDLLTLVEQKDEPTNPTTSTLWYYNKVYKIYNGSTWDIAYVNTGKPKLGSTGVVYYYNSKYYRIKGWVEGTYYSQEEAPSTSNNPVWYNPTLGSYYIYCNSNWILISNYLNYAPKVTLDNTYYLYKDETSICYQRGLIQINSGLYSRRAGETGIYYVKEYYAFDHLSGIVCTNVNTFEYINEYVFDEISCQDALNLYKKFGYTKNTFLTCYPVIPGECLYCEGDNPSICYASVKEAVVDNVNCDRYKLILLEDVNEDVEHDGQIVINKGQTITIDLNDPRGESTYTFYEYYDGAWEEVEYIDSLLTPTDGMVWRDDTDVNNPVYYMYNGESWEELNPTKVSGVRSYRDSTYVTHDNDNSQFIISMYSQENGTGDLKWIDVATVADSDVGKLTAPSAVSTAIYSYAYPFVVWNGNYWNTLDEIYSDIPEGYESYFNNKYCYDGTNLYYISNNTRTTINITNDTFDYTSADTTKAYMIIYSPMVYRGLRYYDYLFKGSTNHQVFFNIFTLMSSVQSKSDIPEDNTIVKVDYQSSSSLYRYSKQSDYWNSITVYTGEKPKFPNKDAVCLYASNYYSTTQSLRDAFGEDQDNTYNYIYGQRYYNGWYDVTGNGQSAGQLFVSNAAINEYLYEYITPTWVEVPFDGEFTTTEGKGKLCSDLRNGTIVFDQGMQCYLQYKGLYSSYSFNKVKVITGEKPTENLVSYAMDNVAVVWYDEDNDKYYQLRYRDYTGKKSENYYIRYYLDDNTFATEPYSNPKIGDVYKTTIGGEAHYYQYFRGWSSVALNEDYSGVSQHMYIYVSDEIPNVYGLYSNMWYDWENQKLYKWNNYSKGVLAQDIDVNIYYDGTDFYKYDGKDWSELTTIDEIPDDPETLEVGTIFLDEYDNKIWDGTSWKYFSNVTSQNTYVEGDRYYDVIDEIMYKYTYDKEEKKLVWIALSGEVYTNGESPNEYLVGDYQYIDGVHTINEENIKNNGNLIVIGLLERHEDAVTNCKSEITHDNDNPRLVEVAYYYDLYDAAIEYLSDGDTMYILDNITMSGPIVFENKDVVITTHEDDEVYVVTPNYSNSDAEDLYFYFKSGDVQMSNLTFSGYSKEDYVFYLPKESTAKVSITESTVDNYSNDNGWVVEALGGELTLGSSSDANGFVVIGDGHTNAIHISCGATVSFDKGELGASNALLAKGIIVESVDSYKLQAEIGDVGVYTYYEDITLIDGSNEYTDNTTKASLKITGGYYHSYNKQTQFTIHDHDYLSIEGGEFKSEVVFSTYVDDEHFSILGGTYQEKIFVNLYEDGSGTFKGDAVFNKPVSVIGKTDHTKPLYIKGSRFESTLIPYLNDGVTEDKTNTVICVSEDTLFRMSATDISTDTWYLSDEKLGFAVSDEDRVIPTDDEGIAEGKYYLVVKDPYSVVLDDTVPEFYIDIENTDELKKYLTIRDKNNLEVAKYSLLAADGSTLVLHKGKNEIGVSIANAKKPPESIIYTTVDIIFYDKLYLYTNEEDSYTYNGQEQTASFEILLNPLYDGGYDVESASQYSLQNFYETVSILAEKPTTPKKYDIYYDTENNCNKYKMYDGTMWVELNLIEKNTIPTQYEYLNLWKRHDEVNGDEFKLYTLELQEYKQTNVKYDSKGKVDSYIITATYHGFDEVKFVTVGTKTTNTATWIINPKEIEYSDIHLGDDLTYNGSSQTRDYSIYWEDTDENRYNLVLNTDFKLDSSAAYTTTATNVDEDSYYFKVMGIGNYCGSQEVAWNILPKEISFNYTNLSIVYNGADQTPSATTTLLGDDTTGFEFAAYDASDVKLTAGNYTDIGTYYCRVTSVTNPNYKLPSSIDRVEYKITEFDISTLSLDDLDITYEDNGLVYNGSEQTKSITSIEYDGDEKNLTIFFDNITFTIDDVSTVYTNVAKYAGDYTLSLTGNGNFKGSLTISWSIAKKVIDYEWDDSNIYYNGQKQHPNITINNLETCDEGKLSVTYTDGNIHYSEDSYTVEVTGITGDASDNYTLPSGTIDRAYWILQRVIELDWYVDSTKASSELNFVYNKQEQKPVCYVKNLVDSDVVTITVDGEQTNVGHYLANAASISGANSSDYVLPSGANTYFDIVAREITIDWGTVEFTYNKTVQKPAPIAGNVVEGDTVTITISDTNFNAGTYTATATISNSNYKLPSVYTKDYTIKQKPVTLTVKSATSVYGDDLKEDLVAEDKDGKVETGDAISYTLTIKNSSGTALTGVVDAGTYNIIGTDTDSNYEITFADETGAYTITRKVVEVEYNTFEEFVYDGTDQKDDLLAWYTDINDYIVTLTIVGYGYKGNSEITDDGNSFKLWGDYVISVNQLEGGNYELSGLTCDYYMDKAGITNVSIEQDGTLTYNSELQTATITKQATVIEESINGKNYFFKAKTTDEYSATLPQFEQAGKYTVYFKITAYNHKDYEDEFTIIIGKKDISKVTGITANDKTYDGLTSAELVYTNAVFDGIISGDTLTVSGVGNFESKDVKLTSGVVSKKVVNITKLVLGGADADNYNLVLDTAETEATITKKALTITAKEASITYGDDNKGNGVDYSGFVIVNNVPETSSELDITGLDYDYTYTKFGHVTDTTNTYTLTPKGITANNYDITFVANTYTVNKKAITITWTNTSLAYNGCNQKPTATPSGTVNNDTIEVVVTGEQKNVGTNYDALASLTDNSKTKNCNYYIDSTKDIKFTITAVNITVKVKNQTIYYGDAKPTFEVEYTLLGDDVGNDSTIISGTAVYTCSYSQFDDKGNYDVTVSGLTFTNYTVVFDKGTLKVDPKAINIKIDNKEGNYSDDVKPLTVTIDDGAIVNGDKNVYSLSCDVTKTSPVGEYAITGTALDNNYSITFTDGVYAIGIASNEIITLSIDNWTYLDTAKTPSATSKFGSSYTYVYKVKGAEDSTYTSTVPSNAGTYIIKVTVSGTTNYSSANSTEEFSIYKKDVDEPTFDSKVFTGSTLIATIPSLTTYTVKQNNGGINVGDYDVILTLPDSSNYKWTKDTTASLADTTCKFSITPKTISIDWCEDNYTYNGSVQVITATYKDVASSNIELTVSVTNFKDAGDYTATASFKNNESNYSLPSTVTKQYTIKQLKVTLNIEAKESVYGDEFVTLTVSNESDVIVNENDELDFTLSVEDATKYIVGKYDIIGADNDSNYEITFDKGTDAYTITARTITILVKNSTSIYGDSLTNPTLEEVVSTSSRLVNSDSISDFAEAEIAAQVGSSVGTYDITGKTKDNSNYLVTYTYESDATKGTYTITARTITLTWQKGESDSSNVLTYTYDKQSHKPYAVAGNLYGTDTLTVIVSGEQTIAGIYDATASLATEVVNYIVPTENTKVFTINPKPITFTWDKLSLTYDGTNQVPIATCTNNETGDTVNITVTGEQKNYGTYTATVSGVDNINYTLPDNGLTNQFNINKREISLGWQVSSTDTSTTLSYIYNGQSQVPYAYDKTLISGDELVITVSGAKTNVGSDYMCFASAISGSSAGNYKLPQNASETFSIIKKVVDLVWDEDNYTYNGTVQEVTAYYNDVSNSKVYAEVEFSYTDIMKDAGKHTASASIEDGNYEISNSTTTKEYTIKEKPITITIKSKSSVYGDDLVALTATINPDDVIAGDTLSYTLAIEYAEKYIVGKYDIIGTDTDSNYAITFGDETDAYTIIARSITVTIASKSSVYGQTIVDLTGSITSGNLVNNDENVYELKSTVTSSSKVDTYDITGEVKNTNYDITFKNGTDAYEITKATMTNPVVTGYTGTYDGADHDAVVSNSVTTVLNQTATLKVRKVSTDNYVDMFKVKNVVDSSTTYEYIFTAPNHNDLTGKFTVAISEKAITVTIISKESIYGDDIVELTSDITTDSVTGDELSFSLSTEVSKTSSIGTYDISGTDTDSNYAITFANEDNSYTIKVRPITVTIEDTSSVYGDSLVIPVATVTTGSIVNNDTGVFKLKISFNNISNVGKYSVLGSTLNTNYNVTFVNEEDCYEITARPITITIDSKTSVYGQSIAKLTAQLTEGSIISGDENNLYSLVCDINNRSNVGKYNITGTNNNSNYSIEFANSSESYEITKKEISILWCENDFIYNGSVQTVLATYKDIDGEVVDLTVTTDVEFEHVLAEGRYLATVSFANNEGNYKLPEIITNNYDMKQADNTIIVIERGGCEYGSRIILPKVRALFGDAYLKFADVEAGPYIKYATDDAAIDYYSTKDAGTYYALVQVDGTLDYASANTKIEFSITPREVDIIWVDNDYVYNKTNQSINNRMAYYVDIENKEVTLNVTFTQNSNVVEFKNAGKYFGTATFVETRSNYVLPSDNIHLFEIEKATYDMSRVVFKDAAYEYDKKEHSVNVSGDIPEGVSVSYTNGNTFKNVGNYVVVAEFIGDGLNYYPISSKSAKLKISANKLVKDGDVKVDLPGDIGGPNDKILVIAEVVPVVGSTDTLNAIEESGLLGDYDVEEIVDVNVYLNSERVEQFNSQMTIKMAVPTSVHNKEFKILNIDGDKVEEVEYEVLEDGYVQVTCNNLSQFAFIATGDGLSVIQTTGNIWRSLLLLILLNVGGFIVIFVQRVLNRRNKRFVMKKIAKGKNVKEIKINSSVLPFLLLFALSDLPTIFGEHSFEIWRDILIALLVFFVSVNVVIYLYSRRKFLIRVEEEKAKEQQQKVENKIQVAPTIIQVNNSDYYIENNIVILNGIYNDAKEVDMACCGLFSKKLISSFFAKYYSRLVEVNSRDSEVCESNLPLPDTDYVLYRYENYKNVPCRRCFLHVYDVDGVIVLLCKCSEKLAKELAEKHRRVKYGLEIGYEKELWTEIILDATFDREDLFKFLATNLAEFYGTDEIILDHYEVEEDKDEAFEERLRLQKLEEERIQNELRQKEEKERLLKEYTDRQLKLQQQREEELRKIEEAIAIAELEKNRIEAERQKAEEIAKARAEYIKNEELAKVLAEKAQERNANGIFEERIIVDYSKDSDAVETPVEEIKEVELDSSEFNRNEAMGIKDSLALASNISNNNQPITKKFIADHLKEKFGDEVIVNERANSIKSGLLPLADTHYVTKKYENGKVVSQKKCFIFVYETEGTILILLNSIPEYMNELKKSHELISLSKFPKSSSSTWYSLVADNSYTPDEILEIVDVVKHLNELDSDEDKKAFLKEYLSKNPQNKEKIAKVLSDAKNNNNKISIGEQEKSLEEPNKACDNLIDENASSLKESLAMAENIVLNDEKTITKKFISEHLKEKFGDEVIVNERNNAIKSGLLPLADTHYVTKKYVNGKVVEQKKCFIFVYETEGTILILLNSIPEYMNELKKSHDLITLSKFPKSSSSTWYSLVVDNSYTSDEVLEIIDVVKHLNELDSDEDKKAFLKEYLAKNPQNKEKLVKALSDAKNNNNTISTGEKEISLEELNRLYQSLMEEVSLKESLDLAESIVVDGDIAINKKTIADHLENTFGTHVEVNRRPDRIKSGLLPLADTHYAIEMHKNGKISPQRKCFIFVFHTKGACLILLRSEPEYMKTLVAKHNLIKLSRFPKSPYHWYAVIADNTYTSKEMFGIIDVVKALNERETDEEKIKYLKDNKLI